MVSRYIIKIKFWSFNKNIHVKTESQKAALVTVRMSYCLAKKKCLEWETVSLY